MRVSIVFPTRIIQKLNTLKHYSTDNKLTIMLSDLPNFKGTLSPFGKLEVTAFCLENSFTSLGWTSMLQGKE